MKIVVNLIIIDVVYKIKNNYYLIMPRRKKNELLKNYSNEEMKYFDKLPVKEKEDIIKIEEELQNNDKTKSEIIPMRFKFLLANTSIINKRVIMNKLNELDVMSSHTGEYAKLYNLINQCLNSF